MLSVSFGSDPGYFSRHVEEHTSPDRGSYYLSAAEHGEPPGRWYGAGAEALGLTGEVDKDTMIRMYQGLVHPVTGEALGARPYQFKDTPERVAEAIAAEGGEVTPERQAEIELAVRKEHREARNYADATFSAPKSWSVLHAALESQGRHEEAEALWAAWMDGVEAGVGYLQETAGYSRAGRHGAKVGGRTSGRWVEAPNWVMSTWRHHTSRDGDPQLHVHVAILNRVQCEDGRWRSLDGQAIVRSRPAAGAIAERVAEESATRRLGISFATRPDGKAREIVGVDEPIRDKFSARRRAINDGVAELARAYEAKYGQAPSAYVLTLISEHVTLDTRKAKPDHPPTRVELLNKWENQARAVLRRGLAGVIDKADLDVDREPVAEAFDPARVIAQATSQIQQSRASWTRHDLIAAINRELPDCLGGLSADQTKALVAELADAALSPGGEVVRLSAPELVAAPDELRRADGRSIYEPPEADRYATTWHLRTEESLLAAARSTDGPKVAPETAERFIEASRLSPSQAAAVMTLLTSGREVDPFLAAAGTGKTFTMATLAQIWEEATSTPALGLTTAERARQVLADQGLAHSANIARWLGAQERLQAGRPMAEDLQYELVPGQLIVVDEASMVTTAHLDAIRTRAAAVGAKVILTGDDHQLGAVGAGGVFKLITEEVKPACLDEVRRFDHEWEREASLRLRSGDVEALAEYDRRGRIHEGSRNEMIDSATQGVVANHLRGDTSLLVVSTNELAAEIASNVRAELVRLGRVEETGTGLRDGNRAGVGDVIMARENDYSSKGPDGEAVINRNVYVVDRRLPDGSLDAHKIDTGTPVRLEASYVANQVELAYASTAHAAQGATVRAGAEIVDDNMSREGLYVGASRGSDRNTIYVVTHDDGDRRSVAERPDGLAVLAEVMEREGMEASATEVMRTEIAAAESLGRLEPIWADLVEERSAAEARQQLLAAFDQGVAREVEADKTMAKITRLMRQAEIAGIDREHLIEEVTKGELSSARSPADVLAWRIERQIGEASPVKTTYASRTPEGDDPRSVYARQLAEAMDRRVHDLGEQAVTEAPKWAGRLGPVPDEADKALEWAERAGAIAAYREAHGYRSEHDPIGPAPLARNVEARTAWERAYEALGRPAEQRELAGATDAELHSHVDAERREQVWAPPHVDHEMREKSLSLEHLSTSLEISQAEADKTVKAGETPAPDANERLHNERAALYKLAADVAALDEISTARRAWYEETREVRDRAAAARRELEVRHPEPKREATPPARQVDDPEVRPNERVTGAPEQREVERAEAQLEREVSTAPEPEHKEPKVEPAHVDVDDALAKARAAMAEIGDRRAAREAEQEREHERSDHEHVKSIEHEEGIEHDHRGESGTY
jgi:conjugative relaxase-like TrwC/TraI family protein